MQKRGLYKLFTGWALQLQVTFELSTADRPHENCLCRGGAEERQTEQSDWLEGLLTIREYQNYLEEGKLIVINASYTCACTKYISGLDQH